MDDLDLLVIGGGINGAGIARDASGRDLRVLLCEQHDLAAHTSSASSKLIHGGLRYLEQGEFGLVRKALGERETVRRQALTWSIRCVSSCPGSRTCARAGCCARDCGCTTIWAGAACVPRIARTGPATRSAGSLALPSLQHGFCYADAQVDDARLVLLNALDAAQRRTGAGPQPLHRPAPRAGPMAGHSGIRRWPAAPGDGARRCQCGWSVGRWPAGTDAGARRWPRAAPGAGQPHRAAPPLAQRQRLPAAAARWARGVPAALRPRPPAGRHHRHRLSR